MNDNIILTEPLDRAMLGTTVQNVQSHLCHSFIHQDLRLRSRGVLLVSRDVCISPAISRRYCRQLALYTQRNCFESVPILVTTPTSSHNLTNDRTSKENNCKIGEVLEEKARIRKGK